MKSFHSVHKAFERSSLAKLVNDAFRAKETSSPKLRERKPARRLDFAMEAMEPRLLLSADISYVPDAGNVLATHFTLKAVEDGGLKIKMFDTVDNVVATSDFDADDGVINVSRSVGGSAFADTVTIDLSTLGLLTPTGDALTINFTGGFQDLFSDTVILSGTASLGYSLSVVSDADISVTGSLTLSDADDDIALTVATTSTGLPTPLTTNDFCDYSA